MIDKTYDDLLNADHLGVLRDHQSTRFGSRNGRADEAMGPLDHLGGVTSPLSEADMSFGSALSRRVGKGAPAGATRTKNPIWTPNPNKNFTPVENAYDHWKRHGKQFPEYRNAKQYVEGATHFLNNPPLDTKMFHRGNGDTLPYRPATNTFGIRNDENVPKTMYKPRTGERYWRGQTKKQ